MKKIFLDMDGTLANFNVENALQRFQVEKGFFANLKAYKGIEKINELVLQNNFYIISASPNNNADKDKMTWLEKYLPNLKKEHILFCRLGENKANFIENKLKIKIDNNLYQVVEFQHVKPGKGNTFMRVTLKSIVDGRTLEHRFDISEKLEDVRVERRQYQYLYKEGEDFIFMNQEDYEQIPLMRDLITGVDFLKESVCVIR